MKPRVRSNKPVKNISLGRRLSERLLDLRQHWAILLILACFALASGSQAVSWLMNQGQQYYQENVAWKAQEERIINEISPNMQIGYVRQLLGEPIFQDGGDNYKEYVFKRKAHWIQVVSDNNGKILLYGLTVCDSSFKPKLSLPVEGEKLD